MTINNQDTSEIFLVVFASIAFFGLLSGFIIYFIILYQKKQRQNQKQHESLKLQFQQEILQARLEIQEQTFLNISQEIHDNIGQVLSFVKLNLATTKELSDDAKEERINENRELIARAISDLRDLSKSLSKDNLLTKGFVPTIQTEIERIAKSGLINIEFRTEGDIVSLGEQRELVLFRIFQESINNTLKHSGANHLKISLQYCTNLFTLTLSDNGCGFDSDSALSKDGSGLKNIRNRANLIGAEIRIIGVVGQGSEVFVSLNAIDKQTYATGNPRSFS